MLSTKLLAGLKHGKSCAAMVIVVFLAMLRAVLADESAYEWVEFANDEDLPSAFHELPAA